MRAMTVLSLALALAACGGPQDEQTTPDESGDLAVQTGVPATIPPGLDGTRWRWVEAHCTEGPLDLLARGYAATVRVSEGPDQLRLITDQVFATEECQQTILMTATPGSPDWRMEEVARVAVPAERECYGVPEPERPGGVRVTDGRLEVLVQRSQWCNGLEVRMVYERAPDELLNDEQIVRRYAAFWTLGDAQSAANLFAEGGSLLEPFTQTQTGEPFRHVGRDAVLGWFEQTFGSAPWRAFRITEIAEEETGGGTSRKVVTWEYMDPRLEEPMSGVTHFTIAAGEIFEARIELTTEPAVREGEDAEEAESSDS